MLCRSLLLVLKMAMTILFSEPFSTVVAAHAGDVYWNSSNQIFMIDNTAHVFTVQVDDYMNLFCPKYDNKTAVGDAEVSLIYRVNEYGKDLCTVNRASDPVLLGFCNRPFEEQFITIRFRTFTPNPNAPEFQPFKTYYFISTSNGSLSGLHNTDGGLCRHKHMQLRIEVKPRVLQDVPTTTTTLSPWGFRPRPFDQPPSQADTYDRSDASDEGHRSDQSAHNYEIGGDVHNPPGRDTISWNDQSRYEVGDKRSDPPNTQPSYMGRQISAQPPVVINLSPAERRNNANTSHLSLSVSFVLSLYWGLRYCTTYCGHTAFNGGMS